MTPAQATQRVTREQEAMLAATEQIVARICGALWPLPQDQEPFAMAALEYALARLEARAPEAGPAAIALKRLALEHLTLEPGETPPETPPGGEAPDILYQCRDEVRRICAAYWGMGCDGYYTPDAQGCAKPNLAGMTRTQKAEYEAYRALGTVEQLAGLAQEGKSHETPG